MIESPFDTTLRDVGVSINKLAGRELITPGRLYVSASLDNATDEDNEILRDEYKLKATISTDQKLDIGANPNKIGASGNVVVSKFLGVTRCRINLRSEKYIKNVRARMSVWSMWYGYPIPFGILKVFLLG